MAINDANRQPSARLRRYVAACMGQATTSHPPCEWPRQRQHGGDEEPLGPEVGEGWREHRSGFCRMDDDCHDVSDRMKSGHQISGHLGPVAEFGLRILDQHRLVVEDLDDRSGDPQAICMHHDRWECEHDQRHGNGPELTQQQTADSARCRHETREAATTRTTQAPTSGGRSDRPRSTSAEATADPTLESVTGSGALEAHRVIEPFDEMDQHGRAHRRTWLCRRLVGRIELGPSVQRIDHGDLCSRPWFRRPTSTSLESCTKTLRFQARRRSESTPIWRSSVRVSPAARPRTQSGLRRCRSRRGTRTGGVEPDGGEVGSHQGRGRTRGLRVPDRLQSRSILVATALRRAAGAVTSRRRVGVVRSRSDRRRRGPPRRRHAHATTARGNRASVLPRARCQTGCRVDEVCRRHRASAHSPGDRETAIERSPGRRVTEVTCAR